MAERILITSTDLMMVQFLLPHVRNLSAHGYDVEIACSEVGNRMNEIREKLKDCVKQIHTVRLRRNPAAPVNLIGYFDMKRIIDRGSYDYIWTNEPVMGVVTRLAAREARRNGTKVLYMVHGFHFYDGAPLVNWLVFYPIERLMASKADVICTINKEDYKRAHAMNVRRVEYIHSIGMDSQRLTTDKNRGNIRRELDLSTDDFLILTVAELNKNKNQQTIIKAVAMLKDSNIHYILCGKGNQLKKLKQLSVNLGIEDKVHFLGYRSDVVDICSNTDVFVLSSHREGISVASLEAMYCGIPIVTSDVGGLKDLTVNGKSGYRCRPDDARGFAQIINMLKNNPKLREKIGNRSKKAVGPFCLENTKKEVLRLFSHF